MSRISLQADSPGIFMFRPPSTVTTSIYRELMVVFQADQPSVTAVVIATEMTSPRDLENWLSAAWLRLGNKPKVSLRVFGGSSQDSRHVTAVMGWVRERSLTLTAVDCGRAVSRNITIDCSSQRVGISYAESTDLGSLGFLSGGTARLRRKQVAIEHRVLFLTADPVRQKLALQTFEELPGWTAEIPTDPALFLRKKVPAQSPWEVVIAAEDAASLGKAWTSWEASFQKTHPDIPVWRTAGAYKLKTRSTQESVFPALTPESIGEFKAAIALIPGWVQMKLNPKKKKRAR